MNIIFRGLKKALENFQRSNSYLWVNSLCYFSILSIAPLFTLAISFGAWLGIDEYLKKIIYENMPFDQKNVEDLIEISQNLLETARGGIFTGIGFIFLGWSLISMFYLIEKSFNSIWNVKRARTFIRRMTDYTSVFILLLVIILATKGGIALISHYLGAESTFSKPLENFLGYVSLIISFTSLYIILPNTKVKFLPAVISGTVVAVLFRQLQLIFVKLQTIIISYNRIYGSFSIILIFLIWVQFLWIFIILGTHFCCLLQNKNEIFSEVEKDKLNFISKLKTAIALIFFFVRNYEENGEALSLEELSKNSQIPQNIVEDIVSILREKNIVGEVLISEQETGYKLLANIDILTLEDIYAAMESYGESFNLPNIELKNIADECLENMNKKTLLKHIFFKKKENPKKIE